MQYILGICVHNTRNILEPGPVYIIRCNVIYVKYTWVNEQFK
jgi:hypothetical protein